MAGCLGLALAVAAACSDNGGVPAQPQRTATATATDAQSPPAAGTTQATPEALGTVRLTQPGLLTVKRGPDIMPSEAVGSIPNFPDSDHSYLPLLAHGRGVIVRREPRAVDSSETREYWLWDRDTSQYTLLWRLDDPRQQDFVAGTDGEWIVTVRFGESLPFPDWEVIVRNPSTGMERTIAIADQRVAEQRNLPVGLPSGFAPHPAIHKGRVVWVEWAFGDDGLIHKYLRLYTLDSGKQETLETINDPRTDDIRLASIGGNRVAWINDRREWSDSHIVVLDLVSGEKTRFVADNTPYRGRLSTDGRFFAWDVAYAAKYVLEIDTLRVDRFGDDQGQDIMVTDDGVSWAAGSGPNARGGYYDFDTRTVRLTAGSGGGASWLLGNGLFVFREFTVNERGQEIEELTTYYIVDISR